MYRKRQTYPLSLSPPEAPGLSLTLIHKSWRREIVRKMNALQDIHDPYPTFP
jgi:hypothetical protein